MSILSRLECRYQRPSAGTQSLGVNPCGGGGRPRSRWALAHAERHDIIEKTIEEFTIKNHKKVGYWEYELIKGEMNGVIEKYNSRL